MTGVPVISDKDIRTSIQKNKDYVTDNPDLESKVTAVGESSYSQLAVHITVPGLKFDNHDQEASFIRLVYGQNHDIQITDVRESDDGKGTRFTLSVNKNVDFIPNETDINEATCLKDDADHYKGLLTNAMRITSNRPVGEGVKLVGHYLKKEQEASDQIYNNTFSKLEEAKQNGNKQFTVIGDVTNDPHYYLYQQAAMDFVKQNPVQAVRLNMMQGYIDNCEKTVANGQELYDHPYIRNIIGGAIDVKRSGGAKEVVGDINHWPEGQGSPEWSTTLKNFEHAQRSKAANDLIYSDMKANDERLASSSVLTLTGNSTAISFNNTSGVVLNTIAPITNQADLEHRAGYYAHRYSVWTPDPDQSALHSKSGADIHNYYVQNPPELKTSSDTDHYEDVLKKKYTDLFSGGLGTNIAVKALPLFVSSDMLNELHNNSKSKYEAQNIGKNMHKHTAQEDIIIQDMQETNKGKPVNQR